MKQEAIAFQNRSCLANHFELLQSLQQKSISINNRLLQFLTTKSSVMKSNTFFFWILSYRSSRVSSTIDRRMLSHCFNTFKNCHLDTRLDHAQNLKNLQFLSILFFQWRERTLNCMIASRRYRELLNKRQRTCFRKWISNLYSLKNIEQRDRLIEEIVIDRELELKRKYFESFKNLPKQVENYFYMGRNFQMQSQIFLKKKSLFKWFSLSQASLFTRLITGRSSTTKFFKIWMTARDRSLQSKTVAAQLQLFDNFNIERQYFNQWFASQRLIVEFSIKTDDFIQSHQNLKLSNLFNVWNNATITKINVDQSYNQYLKSLLLKFYCGWKGFILSVGNMNYQSLLFDRNRSNFEKLSIFKNWRHQSWQQKLSRTARFYQITETSEYFKIWQRNYMLSTGLHSFTRALNTAHTSNYFKNWKLNSSLSSGLHFITRKRQVSIMSFFLKQLLLAGHFQKVSRHHDHVLLCKYFNNLNVVHHESSEMLQQSISLNQSQVISNYFNFWKTLLQLHNCGREFEMQRSQNVFEYFNIWKSLTEVQYRGRQLELERSQNISDYFNIWKSLYQLHSRGRRFQIQRSYNISDYFNIWKSLFQLHSRGSQLQAERCRTTMKVCVQKWTQVTHRTIQKKSLSNTLISIADRFYVLSCLKMRLFDWHHFTKVKRLSDHVCSSSDG
ncbi:hypothetical protein GEMRC1_007618 [Eukaryota sp. GEM-RC1]